MRRPYTALTLLALACSLTACGNGAGSGASSPATTTAPATTSTASATTASSASASVDPSQDPLYLEAVDVYTKYFAEMQKFEAAGYPTRTLPKSITQYMSVSASKDLQQAIDNSLDSGEAPKKGNATKLSKIAPNPGVSHAGSLASLQSCVDGRKVPIVDPSSGKENGFGVLVYRQIYFKDLGHGPVIDYVDAKVVSKCPIA